LLHEESERIVGSFPVAAKTLPSAQRKIIQGIAGHENKPRQAISALDSEHLR
jgi:hypothetical protein